MRPLLSRIVSSRAARHILMLALLVACGTAAAAAAPRIENTVTVPDSKAQMVHVTTVIHEVAQPQLEVGLPNWTPGYYTTEDFARNLMRLTFKDQSGRVLKHQKNHDSLWLVETAGVSSLTIDFDYQATQLDLNKTLVRPNFALLNGTNLFFYVKGHTLDYPETVTLKLPAEWKVTTGLAATSDPMRFTAENYDVLVDCPLLVGEFDQVTLQLRNVPHHLAVVPKGLIPADALQKMAENYLKVIDAHTKMFNEIPYTHYVTINIFDERGIGGLEHLNSYVGVLPREASAAVTLPNFAGLTSHEFFHAFNVKRIRPADMWPYRYDTRNYTRLLWVSEGVTDYYTGRGMLRAGLMTPEEYLQQAGQVLPFVQSVEAAKYISVEEASVNTWFGGIGGGNQPFTVDYYSRGSVLGFLLDVSIRRDTNGAATLDDVMRTLYTNYYKKNRGFTTADLIAEINKLTRKDYKPFFDKYVGGTDPLPYDDVLSAFGLKLVENKTKAPRIGVGTGPDNRVTQLVPGGPAETAGVKLGDLLIGVGNFAASDPSWTQEFRKQYADKDGEAVMVYVLRDNKPLALPSRIKLMENTESKLERLPDATPAQKALLDAFLAGK